MVRLIVRPAHPRSSLHRGEGIFQRGELLTNSIIPAGEGRGERASSMTGYTDLSPSASARSSSGTRSPPPRGLSATAWSSPTSSTSLRSAVSARKACRSSPTPATRRPASARRRRACSTPSACRTWVSQAFLSEKLPEAAGALGDRHRERLGRPRRRLRHGRGGARGGRRDRRRGAQHLLSQRPAGRDAVRQLAPADPIARRPGAGRDETSSHRQALAQRPRPGGVGPRGPGGWSRHPLARQHVRGHGDRPGDGEAADLLRHRRAVRSRDTAARGPDGLPGRQGAARSPADGDRRHRGAVRRAGVPRGRGDGRPGGHGQLQGPRSVGPTRRRSSRRTAKRGRRRSAQLIGRAHRSGEVGGEAGAEG